MPSNAGKIVLAPVFTIKEGKMDAFLKRMMQQAKDSLESEPGCRQFDVLKSDKKPNQILLYEIYDNAEAIVQHRAMPHYKSFRAEIADLVESIDVVEWKIV